jgi:hypothetical protein
MSAACASATLKYNSSVPESTTSIIASEDGRTHSPPMKNRSVLRSGALLDVIRQAHLAPPLTFRHADRASVVSM